jgi:hypothetical protein
VRCWSSLFDVESLLKEKMAPGKWDRFINFQPKDKVRSLIELIETAKAKK